MSIFKTLNHLYSNLFMEFLKIRPWSSTLHLIQLVVCSFNVLHYGSVVWKTAVSVLFFVLFSALSVQWMASYVLTHFNDDYACVTLLMLIHSLHYTFNRETLHSPRWWNKLQLCLTVLHKHLLPVKPTKKTHIFRAVSFSNVMILIHELERSRLLNFQMTHVIIE